MLIDRTHKPWLVATTLIGAAAGAAYWVLSNVMPHGMTGGSVAGLLFGIVGSAMMVFAALLAVRKRLPTWRVGSAQWWLRGHLWLGTLGFVLILFHSGFGWGGLLENLLWISFGLVVVTGFAGVALQHVIPRLLTTRVPLETMVAQIPFLSQTNLFRADQLVAKQVGPLDIAFEPLKPFAEEVLKQQRVLKRESDFPKELAKVYANVPQPEAETKKPHAASDATTAAAKPSPLEQMKGTARPAEPTATLTTPPIPAAAPAAATVAKPKSPLEIMREKAAAKAAAEAGAGSSAATSESASKPASTEKPLSPLEQMKAKMAAKKADTASTPAGGERQGVSPPIDSANDAGADRPESRGANVSPVAESQDVASPAKPKSPLEMMQAKLAAQKAASSDKSAEAPKPLTVEKTPAAEELASKSDGDKKLSPLEMMKAKAASASPAAATKPVAAPKPMPPVAAAPPKPKVVAVISEVALKELRDFHLRAVRPFLIDGRTAGSGLNDLLAARRLFGQLKSDLPADLHETLDQLEAWCEERRQFNTQLRLHRWLHWWLVLHIPPSIALLVLFVAHVVVSLRVVPWGK